MQTKAIALLAFITLAFAPAKKQDLQFKLEKGKVYAQTMEVDSQIKQTMQGQTMETSNVLSGVMNFELKSEGSNGNEYEISYESIGMEMSAMGQTQSFSSDTTSLGMVDPMSRVLAHMSGKDFSATISENGKVSNVSGLDGIIEQAAKAGPGAEQIAEQMSSSFGADGLSKSIEMLTDIFPSGPVDIGDSWKSTNSGATTMPIIIENTFTLKSVEGDIATLDVKSTVDVDPENSSMEMQGMNAQYYLEGTRTGTIELELKTGWVVAANLVDDIFGSITISPNAQLPQGMTIPIEIKNTTTVSGK